MNNNNSRFADFRDGFAAIREIMIVIAILALILVPSKVRAVLETAGIRSVAGIEFDVQELTDAQNEMMLAQQEVEEVRQTLETAQQNLNSVATSGQGISPHSQYITRVLDSAKQTTEHAGQRMSHARSKFKKIADDVNKNIQLTPPSELFGGQSAGLGSESVNR